MNPNIIEGLVKDLSNLKTGWKTSEFWVALVPAIAAVLSVFGVHIGNTETSHILLIVWGSVAGVYTAARTYLKSVHIGHVTSLAALLHQLEKTGGEVAQDVISAVPQNPTGVAVATSP